MDAGILLVLRTLELGGIQTVFLRLCQYRASIGMTTKVVILDSVKLNSDLLSGFLKVSEVIFFKELFNLFPAFTSRIPLFGLLSERRVRNIFHGVEVVHIVDGFSVLIFARLLEKFVIKAKLTIGFYHHEEFAWGEGRLPYYERITRRIVFNTLPKQNLYFFSINMRNFVEQRVKVPLKRATIFPIGVVESVGEMECSARMREANRIKIVSVGRLVAFKAYNFWMLKVVRELVDKGYIVTYDIYGSGDLFYALNHEIAQLDLGQMVELKGDLPLNEFYSVVKSYDIFVGGGTSAIQASSIGVPTIVATDNMIESRSYGFFSDLSGFDYTIIDENRPLHEVIYLFETFLLMSENEVKQLQGSHILASERYSLKFFNSSIHKSCTESTRFLGYNYIGALFSLKINYFLLRFFLGSRVRTYN